MSRFTLRTLLKNLEDWQVDAVHAAWRGAAPARRDAAALADLQAALADEERVEERLKALPAKLSALLDVFLGDPGQAHTVAGIMARSGDRWSSRSEVEAAVVALCREAFVFPAAAGGRDEVAQAGHAVAAELADCIERLRRRQRQEIHGTFTLKGFLNERYFDERQRSGDPEARAADHARKVYKFYLLEDSVAARIDNLPGPVRKAWDLALGKFGGLAPADEIAAALGAERAPDLDLVRKCLEEAMLGTVAPLRLARFGIQPCARAVVVFYEIALICLQRHSRSFPVQVEHPVSCGVDLVSNIGRFLREVGRSKVQFTVQGRLYKASEKRIMKSLLPVPGAFLDAEAQIRFVYRFCLSRRLLDRSGERALRPTESGREFEQLPLMEKLGALLAYSVEERGMPGEDYHQVRLRRILLRLLRRLEPDRWHELPLIPFLARNNYLSRVEEQRVEEFFATRFQTGGYLPTENLQQLCWNLVVFIKRRLFPLGLVELGMRGGRPVAVKLSRLGAELLGATPASAVGGERSEAIVNPDFEILLFPGEDEHEVVHTFDRFAERHKSDRIHHFKLSRASVQAALEDGMTVSQVLQELADRCRARLPQNVLYTLEDWADQAGVLTLEGDELRGRRPDQVDRFLALPKVRRFVRERTSATTVALNDPATLGELQRAVRDRGFFIERRRR